MRGFPLGTKPSAAPSLDLPGAGLSLRFRRQIQREYCNAGEFD